MKLRPASSEPDSVPWKCIASLDFFALSYILCALGDFCFNSSASFAWYDLIVHTPVTFSVTRMRMPFCGSSSIWIFLPLSWATVDSTTTTGTTAPPRQPPATARPAISSRSFGACRVSPADKLPREVRRVAGAHRRPDLPPNRNGPRRFAPTRFELLFPFPNRRISTCGGERRSPRRFAHNCGREPRPPTV